MNKIEAAFIGVVVVGALGIVAISMPNANAEEKLCIGTSIQTNHKSICVSNEVAGQFKANIRNDIINHTNKATDNEVLLRLSEVDPQLRNEIRSGLIQDIADRDVDVNNFRLLEILVEDTKTVNNVTDKDLLQKLTK